MNLVFMISSAMVSYFHILFRHMLLKMQRSMRAKSANEKRQLLMMRQQEQRKALPGHTDCDTPGGMCKINP